MSCLLLVASPPLIPMSRMDAAAVVITLQDHVSLATRATNQRITMSMSALYAINMKIGVWLTLTTWLLDYMIAQSAI